jgi:ribosomal protein S18 acetylase RimI-like enzyme
MIQQLIHSHTEVAFEIYTVFQNAYKVEAQLINVVEFPPLARSAENISNSASIFYGYFENESLAAVIELTREDNCLSIDSLTVEPEFFRRGIANKLLAFTLELFSSRKTVVETAAANTPAIILYQKHGFVEFKRWVPDHGIEKIAMSIE